MRKKKDGEKKQIQRETKAKQKNETCCQSYRLIF